MANFAPYYPKLLKYEGGYASAAYAASNGDKGGETYLGIARNYNPTWEGWKRIDDYKKAHGEPKLNSHIPDAILDKMAQEMSKKLYWDKLKLDQVNNQSIAEFMMDYGFNSGLATPVKVAQRHLGLKEDGVMGPDTLAKVNATDQGKLFKALQDHRVNLINTITSNGKLSPNLRTGLLNRAKGWAYDNKGTVAAVGLGFFFWIILVVVVYFIFIRKKK